MTKKKENPLKKWTMPIGTLVIVFLLIGGVIWAQSSSSNAPQITDSTVYITYEASGGVFGGYTPITSATSLTDLDITNDLRVQGEYEASATTTLQEITLGSRYAKVFDFSAGNTTTPGKIASIQNLGEARVCNKTEINISTSLQGNYDFSLTTSTAAFGDGVAPKLIASSTVATSTLLILNNVDDPGTGTMDSWIWAASEYVLASFTPSDTREHASSTEYINAVGGFYVACHTQ